MKRCEAEAYEGARLAFTTLNPNEGEAGWEQWLGRAESMTVAGSEDTDMLVQLCDDCLSSEDLDLAPSTVRRISQAAGYFMAVNEIVDELASDEGVVLVD